MTTCSSPTLATTPPGLSIAARAARRRVGHFSTEAYLGGVVFNTNRNNWGVRPFSRFSRRGLAEQWTRLRSAYAAGGRIFIFSTAHSLTLTGPVSPRE